MRHALPSVPLARKNNFCYNAKQPLTIVFTADSKCALAHRVGGAMQASYEREGRHGHGYLCAEVGCTGTSTSERSRERLHAGCVSVSSIAQLPCAALSRPPHFDRLALPTGQRPFKSVPRARHEFLCAKLRLERPCEHEEIANVIGERHYAMPRRDARLERRRIQFLIVADALNSCHS